MMWIFLETSHFVLLGKYMNTISCKKKENTLNGIQDNHFLQCVEFMTEQTFAMTSEKKEKLRGDLCVFNSFHSTAWAKQASYLDIFPAWSTNFE